MTKLNEYVSYTEHENKIYMPNEIFIDLKKSGLKGSKHIAFAYSYYWLMCWLYRYTKYGNVKITVGMIKEILGCPLEKRYDYIIKKNGSLDQIGYTMSDTDYPISWIFNDGDIEFTYFSEMDKDVQNIMRKNTGTNYKVKIPVKGLWRSEESMLERYYDGTFYDISNTHEMTVDVFERCMTSECKWIGFYLYGFLKDKCQKHGEYQSSYERIAKDTGLSKNTVIRYTEKLVVANLIECEENDCKKIEENFQKESNTYKIV